MPRYTTIRLSLLILSSLVFCMVGVVAIVRANAARNFMVRSHE